MKAGSILGYGVDACVFYEPLQCESPSLTKPDSVSKLLPADKAITE